jgi:16S rRNA (guanine527-N7)-methyltransferase
VIDGHVRLLLAWNAAINLTSIRDAATIAVRHVVDSVAAVAPLRERGVTELVDLGSGGGFPGLPLAAALPAVRTLLVESIAKKARFLETVIAATGVSDRVAVHATRVEALAADARERERWPAVTARAVGDLAELVELSFPLLRPGGVLVAWKQGDIEAELHVADPAIAALGGGDLDVRHAGASGLDGHVLVIVTKIGRTPDAYPRDPAARRRRGW